METILDAFLRNAAAAPDRVAFVQGDTQLTFDALEQQSAKAAAGLAHSGISRGMPIGILVTQPLNFPIAILALWRLGAIVVPFDPGAPPEDRAAREAVVDLAYLIADADLSLARKTTQVLQISSLLISLPLAHPASLALDDDCLFMFTSGTTGRPKALIHTHASLSQIMHRNINLAKSVVRDDIVLATIPLQLATGLLNLVFSPLVAGATVIIVLPFSARVCLRAALHWHATCLLTVPAIMRLLASLPEKMGRPPLRRASTGSAQLDTATYSDFRTRYGISPVRTYGLSEIGTAVTCTGDIKETGYRPTVGWPLVELHLLDDAGNEAQPGKPGEIALRADSLCRAYCLIEGGVREPLPMKDGLFLTGDLGRLEADGALVLIGRKKSFINGPRLRVNPREVEEVLLRMPGVHDAAVVPTPGRHGYEDIHAFIAADHDVDEATVALFCATRLAAGKRPQIIDFIDAIPRNASGKVEVWRLRSAVRRAGD